MKWIDRLRGYVSFTRNEQKILLFLAVLFLAGAAIKVYRSSVVPPRAPRFDYSESDSVFAARSTIPAAPSSIKQQPVNINAAGVEELDGLPGIGPSMARQIVEYRNEHGPFKSLQDLRNIKGLGPKKLEKLQPMVTLQ
ncbi:MAG: helix-hairpin-helix domain-containing protein [Ignavibacteriales bacterium]|nr:helix-hairpin-helix domain-containing protein [Ignavibacteriales bacterium]